jgi:hypothetical protein
MGSIQAVFERTDRSSEIIRRRSFITDPEHRFFFALLLNLDTKESIFSLIRKRFPDVEPREKVLDWVYDLSQTRVVGAKQENALGIESFDDLDLSIFEHLLDGKSVAESVECLRGEYPAEKLAEIGDGLSARGQRIRDAVLFTSLFQ